MTKNEEEKPMHVTFMTAVSRPRITFTVCLLVSLVATCCLAAEKKKKGPVTVDDFTRPYNPAAKVALYNVGPTGMLGEYPDAVKSHQIRVRQVAKGSPADGKMLHGDVITGANGVSFEKGGNIIIAMGNAIDEAEKKENGGKLKLTVWRDANVMKRHKLRNINVKEIDVTSFIEVIEADDSADLARYKSEHQLQQDAGREWKESYEKVPIQAVVKEVTLQLPVMGSYSEDWNPDCPKYKKIRDQGYPHIIKKITAPKGFKRWDTRILGMALLASDNPEHVEIVKQVMRREMKTYPEGGGPWPAGYDLPFLAEYCLRTGDKDALAKLARFANSIARNVSPGGTGGHGWCNRLPMWTDPYGPGRVICVGGNYGELNNGPNRCFYGLTLARQAGIKDPVVNDAIRRMAQFHTSWVDRGLCPYGFHHPVTGRESNNGKNGPLALACRMLGQHRRARYHAMMSAIQGISGYKSGHGDGTFARTWPELGAHMAGKEATMAMMKVRRPYYTMSRQYNGTFVSPSGGNGLGIGSLYDPTAIAVLHMSMPLKKLYMTGRDVPSECFATPRDLKNLEDRINHLDLTKLSTDQMIAKLDSFNPNDRRKLEEMLVEKYKDGETEILPKVKKLLSHEDRRVRESALKIYAQFGQRALREIEPILLERLKDPAEIVRCAAIEAIGVAAGGRIGKAKRRNATPERVDIDRFLKPLVDAAFATYEDHSADHVNTYSAVVSLLHGTDNSFARDPFGSGLDDETVYRVLERFMYMDPRGDIMKAPSRYWDRETCIRMAGPLVFIASQKQINSKMFVGSTVPDSRALLARNKFLEVAEASYAGLDLVHRFPWGRRQRVGKTILYWKTSIFAHLLTERDGNQPEPLEAGVSRGVLPWIQSLAVDDPGMVGGRIRHILSKETPADWTSLADAATKAFFKELDGMGGKEAQIAHCRLLLSHPESKRYYQMQGAMTRLVETLGVKAIDDLVPYLNHEEWRFSEHSQDLVRQMKLPGTTEALVGLTGSKDPGIAVVALRVLARRGDKEGAVVGLKLISTHENPRVRGAAAQAVYAGTQYSTKALVKILLQMKGLSEQEEIDCYEYALLSGISDPKNAPTIATAIKKVVPSCTIPVRRSLYYILGQIGGAENLQYLKGQAEALERLNTPEKRQEQTETEFAPIIDAISRSPDISATGLLLEILKEHKDSPRAGVVSRLSEKRLMNGGETIGLVPDDVNMDFAEVHLKLYRNQVVLKFMGTIPTERSVSLLLHYMKQGPTKVTQTCAKMINQAAKGVPMDTPLAERKIIADALTQVMEYVMAVHLKGARVVDAEEDPGLAMWKRVADSAGQTLRRIYNPEEMIHQAPAPAGGGGGVIGPVDNEDDIDI